MSTLIRLCIDTVPVPVQVGRYLGIATPTPRFTLLLDDRPVFATKSGQTTSATFRGSDTNQRTAKATRRVTFTPDAQAHSSASEIGMRSVPVKGLFSQSPSTSSQTRPPFATKSANQTSSRWDPFSGGTSGRASAPTHLAQPHLVSSPRSAYGSGISIPVITVSRLLFFSYKHSIFKPEILSEIDASAFSFISLFRHAR
jgi:hypothetical protein